MAQVFKIPAGPDKDVALEQAQTKSIEIWLKRKEDELVADPQNRWAEFNKKWIAAAKQILADRKSGKAKAPPAPGAAAAAEQAKAIEKASGGAGVLSKRSGGTSIEAAIHDPAAVTTRLNELKEGFHLVSPVTRVDALPPGCGISISFVTVDPNPDQSKGPKEVYKVGDRLGLSGDTLKRIAGAAGIDWDPRQSGRLDDGSDPHYCHYRAVGYVRAFDGALRTITGEVEMDAREGSPQIEEIRTKALARESEPGHKGKKDGGASQILELRKFLLRHAESKAKNRAISDMGVKRSYAPAELAKPFAVARIVWTGQTDDPELKREFARMHAERMMDGASALYGRQPPALPLARPAPAVVHHHTSLPPFQGHSPPPLAPRGNASEDDWSGGDYGGEDFDASGEEASEGSPEPEAQASEGTKPAAQSEASGNGGGTPTEQAKPAKSAPAADTSKSAPAKGAAGDGGDVDRGNDPDRY